ncbi:MAG: diacylglycerol kinase family lipid kinase [Verrucomicrobia bacterium]|nr:diacylglycerol kinase family lipid kinase [Verrucomicrobiota bacterium]
MSARRYRQISFFVNPASGNVEPSAREMVQTRLERLTDSLQVHEVTPASKLVQEAQAAAEAGADLVVVAGGDGTIREAASGLVKTGVPLGIVPLGTFNNLALSLGIPRELDAACAILENGRPRKIDVGLADERHFFFEAAGVGVDAELFPIGEMVKQGRRSMLLRAIRLVLSHRQSSVVLRFDQTIDAAYQRSFRGSSPVRHRRHRFRSKRRRVRLRCSFLAVANGPYYGTNFAICPTASLDDGRLTIAVFRDFSKRELLTHLWSISGGRYHLHPKMELFEARTLEVTSRKRLFVHVDGLPIGTTPVRFRTLHEALIVMVKPDPRDWGSPPATAAQGRAAEG